MVFLVARPPNLTPALCVESWTVGWGIFSPHLPHPTHLFDKKKKKQERNSNTAVFVNPKDLEWKFSKWCNHYLSGAISSGGNWGHQGCACLSCQMTTQDPGNSKSDFFFLQQICNDICQIQGENTGSALLLLILQHIARVPGAQTCFGQKTCSELGIGM